MDKVKAAPKVSKAVLRFAPKDVLAPKDLEALQALGNAAAVQVVEAKLDEQSTEVEVPVTTTQGEEAKESEGSEAGGMTYTTYSNTEDVPPAPPPTQYTEYKPEEANSYTGYSTPLLGDDEDKESEGGEGGGS